jgi:hypothetical protein
MEMKPKKAIVSGEGFIPVRNRYRLTFRDDAGKVYECEVTASTMSTAVSENKNPGNLVKVERIDPETGAVLGGLYTE